MTRRHGPLRVAVGAMALLAAACAGAGDEGGAFGGPDEAGAFSDAGVGAGAPPGLDGLLATPSSRYGDDFAESDGLIGMAGSCFDATDDDGDGDGVDCRDAGCAALRSCCVGDGDCCAPVAPAEAPLPPSVDFGACAGDPAGCAGADVRGTFGDPGPAVVGGALRPGGGLAAEGGVVLGGAVDLRRRRVAVDVVFDPGGACAAPCVEAAGVALVDEAAALAGPQAVRPAAGLLLSRARDEVQLVLGDAVVASWPADGTTTWTFVAKPDGRVAVARDGAPAPGGEATYRPAGPARLVLHGRNATRPAGTGAGVASVATRVALCDVPDAWSTVERLDLVDAPAGADAPTLAFDGEGDAVLAVAAGGRIHVARRPDPSTPARFVFDPQATIGPGGAHDAGGLEDPALVSAGGALTMFYTAVDADGRRTIGRADPDVDGVFVPRPAPILAPVGAGVVGYDRPTATLAFDGTWVLVVRAVGAEGDVTLRAFASIDAGRRFARVEGSGIAEAAALGGTRVESASLVVHNGAWQLLVARRDGARHRVDLLATDDLLRFRVVARAILGGSAPFDALGARAVGAATRPDALEVVYVGLDGVEGTLARAFRPSPSFGVRDGL